MLNKKSKYFVKDKIKKSLTIKHQYLNIIQKSLFHNRYLEKKKRTLLFFNINKSLIEKKNKNICLISGENTAVNKKLLLSRFNINSSSLANKLQNFKINSW